VRYKLRHGQGSAVAELDSSPADTLVLEATGAKYFEWSVQPDRQALDLELRARIVETTATLGTTPVVRWGLELGHGEASWTLPAPSQTIISGTPLERPILPGRGIVLRVSARRLRITFQGGFNLTGGAVARSKILVSCQPAAGDKCCNADWRQQYDNPAELPAPAHSMPFPMGATEFRIRSAFTGAPFGAGACGVLFTSIAGQLLGVVDVFASLMGDWTPIPVHAVACQTTVAAQLDYR